MDKLDKHIKEKLEQRTIAPSKGSWDKIASQLEQQQLKSSKKWFPYAVAASILGIVLVSVFLFTKDQNQVEQIQLVDSETNSYKETQVEEKIVDVEDKIEVVQKASETVEMDKRDNLTRKNSIPNTVIAKEEEKQPLKDELIINSDKLITQKVEEVVAQVTLMESEQQNVSDAEVDSLLRAAQRQILTDRLFAEGGSVDAMSLLAEVEDELDESFRDQIFDALKSGYLKLRTAVADRNQ
tara:strand:- start:70396 stop:71112 length:717 start_codon:yes stop_codon:yes gene_type:complete